MKSGIVNLHLGSVSLFERGDMVIGIDGGQIMLEMTADVALNSKSIQCVRVFLDAEHRWHASVKVNFDVIEAPRLPEAIPGHPHDLLRC